MIEINQIADVLNYTEGLKAVVFDLDDTLYGEKEYIRSGYRAVAKVIPQVENAERKLWRFFLEKKPAIDEVLSMEGIYTEEIRQRCLGVYRLHEPREQDICVRFSGDAQDEALLLQQLIDSDVLVNGFTREKGSLESVFMQLTEHEEEKVVVSYDAESRDF